MSESTLPADTTRRLATWVAGLRYEDLPAEVVAVAKRQILDTLAVAWAGTRADAIEPLRRLIGGLGGAPEAPVWCYGERLPATQAAFLNGMLASALDYDSLHDRATVHPDVVTLPAIMALAEQRAASGRELITALVAGDELLVRLGLAARSHPGWFYSSAFGVFGAAAAASRLLGLGADQTLHALGIAMSQAAGTQQALLERSLTKRLQTAYAARAGVESALFAQAGVTGPAQPLEGASGIQALYTGFEAGELLGDLGTRYAITGMTLKKYASCMCNHAPIEATLQLAARHHLRAADVAALKVTISPFMHRLTGAPFEPGDNPQVSAQFSVQYSVASALLRGRFEVRDIEPAAVLEPEVLALAARVQVQVDATAGKFVPAVLELRTHGGATHTLTVDTLPGTPAAPLSEAALHHKALAGFTSAAKAMDEVHALGLIARLQALEHTPDVRGLLG
ncbi:MAG: MmgE/PrpD family protein [Rhizobacter sp.]|nr:MmgE/PrpD family protein [Rhizobacter sp.]